MRWPQGYQYQRCQSQRIAISHNGRKLWEFLECGYQCSSIAGTIIEAIKSPLRKSFLSMYLMTQSKNAISVLELKRLLIVIYKTKWMMKHKLLGVMWQCEVLRTLEGRAKNDDTYLGGERARGKVRRDSENIIPFVAAVQTNRKRHPICIRLDMVKSFKNKEIEAWARRVLATSATVVSDDLWAFGDGTAQGGVTHLEHYWQQKKSAKYPQF
jgi:hypothetical protein